MRAALPSANLAALTRLAARAADPFGVGSRRNVLIVADGDQIGVVAHGGLLGVVAHQPARVEQAGAAWVPADRMHELVTKLGAGEATVALAPNHHVELRRGRRKLTLAGEDPAEAPPLPERPDAWTTLPRGALAVAMREVLYAAPAPDDQQRPQLKAVRVEAGDGVVCAFATDGSRGAYREAPYSGPAIEATVPQRLVIELVRGLFGRLRKGEEELSVDDAAALGLDFAVTARSVWLRSAGAADVTVASPLITTPYPAWRGLSQYDAVFVGTATLDRAEWLESTTALAAIDSRDGRDVVRLAFGARELAMTAEGTAESGGGDAVTAEVTPGGGSCDAAVNARYLRDALRSYDTERVRVRYGGPTDPVRVAPVTAVDRDASWALIMPMAR